MQKNKKTVATTPKRATKRRFPRVRTNIRAGIVNYGAPDGDEEELLWDWVDGNSLG